MNAGARPRPGILRAAALAALDFVVESAPAAVPAEPRVVVEAHPVVAVVGLARRCGATVVARGLAAELACRAPGGLAAVTAADAAGVGLGVLAAGRLARSVAASGAGTARAAGRLCLFESDDPAAAAAAVGGLAPLVIDTGDPGLATAAADVADAVVLVAAPPVEPALAELVSASLARMGAAPLVVLTRARSGWERWDNRVDVVVPESRMAAQAALGGRLPRGEAGRAIGELADLVSPER